MFGRLDFIATCLFALTLTIHNLMVNRASSIREVTHIAYLVCWENVLCTGPCVGAALLQQSRDTQHC